MVNPISPEILFGLVALFILLIGSAMVSGSEVAYFSLNRKRLSDPETEQDPILDRILHLLDKPRMLLATILIANNLFNISIIILAYYVVNQWFQMGDPLVKFVVEVLSVTFIIVLLGEVVPKVYANHHSLPFARFMSGPLLFLRKIFYPLAMLLVRSTHLLERRLQRHKGRQVTKEEVDHAIELATGTLSRPEERNILKGIVNFGDTSVRQIMNNRVDIVALDVGDDFKKVYDTILESGFSRLPVYRDDLDHIEGILYAKDLLRYLNEPPEFKWMELVRPTFFVPENKKIEELLREFQSRHTHLAIAVDEYGGTSGIVTLEDIMEEIIGEIKDEYDNEEELGYEQIDERTFIFEGKTLINDFGRAIGVRTEVFDDVVGDAESLAGLMLELFHRIPAPGDTMDYKGYRFEVVSVSRRHIQKVKVMLPEPDDS